MEIKQEILDQIRQNDKETKTVTVEIRNKVEIVGEIETEMTLSHEVHGEGIYTFILKVPRLRKGVFDHLVVEVPERGMNLQDFKIGDRVRILGQFRSANRKEENEKRGHLYLSIFVESLSHETSTYKVNEVRLRGHLCKEPNFRTTPTGREICDLILAVNRNYERCDYIPCVTWGRDAKYASEFKTGDGFFIVGRLQSRVYRKRVGETEYIEKTAYEVSVSEIKDVSDDVSVTETKIVSA